jgi:hypothetical protein
MIMDSAACPPVWRPTNEIIDDAEETTIATNHHSNNIRRAPPSPRRQGGGGREQAKKAPGRPPLSPAPRSRAAAFLFFFQTVRLVHRDLALHASTTVGSQ